MRLQFLGLMQLFTLTLASNSTYHVQNITLPQPTSPLKAPPVSDNYTSCHDIRRVPRVDQCQFALDYCEEYEIGFVNYVNAYYCHTASFTRLITLGGFVLVLVTLFTTLGITASDFLCPNLDTLAKVMHLSESLAGVTLLALGNGSPDVFSTLESFKLGSANLAIGELIGAALFITAVVVGSMAIVHPFEVVKRPFVRDVTFLLIGVIVMFCVLADGVISFMEGMLMLWVYLGYVILVVTWDYIVTKKRKAKLDDQRARNHFLSDEGDVSRYNLDEDREVNDEDLIQQLGHREEGLGILDQLQRESIQEFDSWRDVSMLQRFRPSMLDALMHHKSTDEITLQTMEPIPIRISSAPQFRDDARELDVGEYERRTGSAPSRYRDDPDEVDEPIEPTIVIRAKSWAKWRKLLFPTLNNFKSAPFMDKALTVISLPMVTILRVTIPVIKMKEKIISYEDIYGDEYLLLLIQSVVSPLVVSCLWFGVHWKSLLSILLSMAIVGVSILCHDYYYSNGSYYKGYAHVLCLLGFIISISWISTIATELIAMIKFFSVLLNLSDAILGVTVFAIGNSLGDFISNFTIAKMGFPMMALSACFGGPLLNILLGVGTGTLIHGQVQVHRSTTLVISGFALLINLVGLLVVVPINGWKMDKRVGLMMIGLWSIATVLCCIAELF